MYSGHCQVSNLECFFEIGNLTNFLLDDIKAKQGKADVDLFSESFFLGVFNRRIQNSLKYLRRSFFLKLSNNSKLSTIFGKTFISDV